MYEQLLPINELNNLRFSVASLAAQVGEPGSYARENAQNAARGIQQRINWIVKQLEAAGEGKKYSGG